MGGSGDDQSRRAGFLRTHSFFGNHSFSHFCRIGEYGTSIGGIWPNIDMGWSKLVFSSLHISIDVGGALGTPHRTGVVPPSNLA